MVHIILRYVPQECAIMLPNIGGACPLLFLFYFQPMRHQGPIESRQTMRPTTSDIAKTAKVSLATVDRVLNDRPGVAEKTVTKVNAAIQKLGYVRDVSAANLAKKRQYKLVFVLPDEKSEFLKELSEEIEHRGGASNTDRTQLSIIRFPTNEPHTLVHELRKIKRRNIDGVAIMARATPQLRDAIAELHSHGIPVVALVSDQPESDADHFIGIDNVAAGRTAGVLMGRFLPSQSGKIAVLTNSIQSYDSLDRRRGFDEVMSEQFPHLEVLPTIEGYGNTRKIQQALSNTLKRNKQTVGLYSLSSGNRAMSELLAKEDPDSKLVIIAHELTKHSTAALRNRRFDAVITQNRGHIVRSAVRVLIAKSDQMTIDISQERIRIEIVLKENLID